MNGSSSDGLDRQAGADGIGDLADVGGVGGHDGVVAADGALDDGDVDDVVMASAGGERANGLGLVIGEGFGVSQGEETGQARLA